VNGGAITDYEPDDYAKAVHDLYNLPSTLMQGWNDSQSYFSAWEGRNPSLRPRWDKVLYYESNINNSPYSLTLTAGRSFVRGNMYSIGIIIGNYIGR